MTCINAPNHLSNWNNHSADIDATNLSAGTGARSRTSHDANLLAGLGDA